MKRKKSFILIMTLSMVVIVSLFIVDKQMDFPITQLPSTTTLPIPPLLEDENADPNASEFTLEPQEGVMSFKEGIETETMGYNGNFLGPLIRVKKGENVKINIHNKLNEPTTVHWHGLEVGGAEDGGPHQRIKSDESQEVNFTVNQPAATLWYHPHYVGSTATQVYKGLAGLLYVEDEESDRLNLPKDYGINDIPLIIQDRQFDVDGSLYYNENSMHPGAGDTMLVNGAINPNLDVNQVKMRFRIVNGSNERAFNLKLSDQNKMTQIASDGGFLENPVALNYVFISSGERAEVIIDFSQYGVGKKLSLMSGEEEIMTFTLKGKGEDQTIIPDQLTTIERLLVSDVRRTRTFELSGMGHMVSINDKQFNMMRIDEEVEVGATEIWEVTNPLNGMHVMGHPFHVHGTQFQILSINGETPTEKDSGWKDTIFVNPGDNIKLIVKFNQKGIYMYHCHILSHEEEGMMGQAKVE